MLVVRRIARVERRHPRRTAHHRADVTYANRVGRHEHCVTFDDALVVLRPDESAKATLTVDLQNDPAFKGSLGVPATGFDGNGREIFAIVICTRVPP
jgi:hypothetical protein